MNLDYQIREGQTIRGETTPTCMLLADGPHTKVTVKCMACDLDTWYWATGNPPYAKRQDVLCGLCTRQKSERRQAEREQCWQAEFEAVKKTCVLVPSKTSVGQDRNGTILYPGDTVRYLNAEDYSDVIDESITGYCASDGRILVGYSGYFHLRLPSECLLIERASGQ